MPRTKQYRERNSSGHDQTVRDFNRLVQLRIREMDLEIKNLKRTFDTSKQCILKRYTPEILATTLCTLISIEASPVKENLPPKTPRVPRTAKKSVKPQKTASTKRVTAASDDGYQSESAASQASKLTARSRQRSRSTSRDQVKHERVRSTSRDRKTKLNIVNTQKKKELLKTPSTKTANDFVITPKIKLNSAMNVLRKPKDGEMVFSTQGSPLMVSTTVSDRTANINVPLRNGNIISLLPFNETSLTDNLFLDEETKDQLKILQSHLSKVLD